MRGRSADKDIQIHDPSLRSSATPDLSHFLQKLDNSSGENAENLNDNFKHSNLQIKGFRLYPNSRGANTVVVSFFSGPLGNWAYDHVDEIFRLDSIDALTAYVCVSFSNETWRARIYIR